MDGYIDRVCCVERVYVLRGPVLYNEGVCCIMRVCVV